MVGNDLLMQFQADLLGVPVIRPKVAETTALGAAYAAGLATGFWSSEEDLRENWVEDKRWEPHDGRRASATSTTSTGRRPSPGPSTGSTPRARRPIRDGAGGSRLPPRHTARRHACHPQDRRPGHRRRRHRRRRRVGRALRGFDVVLVDRARPRRGHERPLPRPAALRRALRGQGPARGARVHRARTRSCAASPPTASRTPAGCSSRRPYDDPPTPTASLEGCATTGVPTRGDRRRPRRCAREPRLNPGITRAFRVPDASIDVWKTVWALAHGGPAARRDGSCPTTRSSDVQREGDAVVGARLRDERTGEEVDVEAADDASTRPAPGRARSPSMAGIEGVRDHPRPGDHDRDEPPAGEHGDQPLHDAGRRRHPRPDPHRLA